MKELTTPQRGVLELLDQGYVLRYQREGAKILSVSLAKHHGPVKKLRLGSWRVLRQYGLIEHDEHPQLGPCYVLSPRGRGILSLPPGAQVVLDLEEH